MTNYDKEEVRKKIIEFCRFPAPRTPKSIVEMLKMNVKGFYGKTPSEQVVKFLEKKELRELVEKNIILEYSPKDNFWNKARTLLSYYYSKVGKKKPRKLKKLYHVNFLHLSDDVLMFNLPKFPEVNLDAVAIFYRIIKDKNIENFSLNLLNLIYSYSSPVLRDDVRIILYDSDLSNDEKELIEKVLEVVTETNSVQEFFNSFPFQPSIKKAEEFIKKISE